MDLFEELMKILQRKLSDPSLSMDEVRVIWEVRRRNKSKQPQAMVGDFNPPPDGYLDSTVGLGYLDFPQETKTYCDRLVSKGYLCRHGSRAEMVRISDSLASICDEIFKRFY